MADGANQIIEAAEAFGSGSEHFTAMAASLAGRMQGLKGKDKPLEGAIEVNVTLEHAEEPYTCPFIRPIR
ncbi:MAG: hypothetical protein LBF75_06160 [Treponema sp.]|nr:hypothetical protein [Treponema sp.]